jgi:hypothetical protein
MDIGEISQRDLDELKSKFSKAWTGHQYSYLTLDEVRYEFGIPPLREIKHPKRSRMLRPIVGG